MSKLAIITGCSRGIGLATAEAFLHDGWQIIGLSRTSCPNSNVDSRCVDITQADALETHLGGLIEKISNSERCCLIHNAGQPIRDRIGKQNIGRLKQAFDVFIVAAAHLNNHLLQHLPASSSVLYVGSTLSNIATPGNASYTIMKHAINGMMQASCQDLAGRGIHTCCVCPGFTDTELLHGSMPTAAAIDWAKQSVAAKRLISPEEIAELLLYCANHPVINGASIDANLGLLQS